MSRCADSYLYIGIKLSYNEVRGFLKLDDLPEKEEDLSNDDYLNIADIAHPIYAKKHNPGVFVNFNKENANSIKKYYYGYLISSVGMNVNCMDDYHPYKSVSLSKVLELSSKLQELFPEREVLIFNTISVE